MAGKKRTEEKARYRHLSELGGLEMLQARYVRQRFPRHVHETYCIGVIEDGAQRFYRSGGEHVAPRETSFSSMPMMCIPDAPNWKTAGLTGPFILIPICSGLYPGIFASRRVVFRGFLTRCCMIRAWRSSL